MKKLIFILLLTATTVSNLQAQQLKIDSANAIVKELFDEKIYLKLDEVKIQTYYENDKGEMVPGDQIWWKEFLGAEVRSNLSLLIYGKLRDKEGKIDKDVAHNWSSLNFEEAQYSKIRALAQLIEEIVEQKLKRLNE